LDKLSEPIKNHPAGLKQATEKLEIPRRAPRTIPQGLKANVDLISLIGTDKSVPFQNRLNETLTPIP